MFIIWKNILFIMWKKNCIELCIDIMKLILYSKYIIIIIYYKKKYFDIREIL